MFTAISRKCEKINRSNIKRRPGSRVGKGREKPARPVAVSNKKVEKEAKKQAKQIAIAQSRAAL